MSPYLFVINIKDIDISQGAVIVQYRVDMGLELVYTSLTELQSLFKMAR